MSLMLVLLLVLTALTMLGNGLVAPVLALYGAEFSASTTLIGMLITVFGVSRLLTNFPAGLASDRFGARTMLITATLLLLGGSAVAAAAGDIITLLVARGVQGVGSGIFMTVVGVLVARQSKEGSRGRTMALYSGAVFTGASLGPVVGGLLAEHYGLSAPFWAYSVVAVAALVVSLFADATRPEPKAAGAGEGMKLRGLVRDPRFISVCFMSALQGMIRTGVLWLLIPLLVTERFSMGFSEVGFALTVVSIGNLVTIPLGGWLVDRFGSRRITPMTAVLIAGCIATIALTDSLPVLWVAIVLLGLSSGINSPTVGASTIEVSPPHLLGPVMGLQRTMVDIGFVGGPLLVGLLHDVFNFGATECLVGVAGLLLANGAFWAFAWHGKRDPAT